jgi:hypothetical protein
MTRSRRALVVVDVAGAFDVRRIADYQRASQRSIEKCPRKVRVCHCGKTGIAVSLDSDVTPKKKRRA